MEASFQTLAKLTQKVLQRLSMYKGSSVQVYAEDRVMQMILDQYDLVMDNFAWNNLTFWKKFTLSGSQGQCLEKVSDYVTNFTDIVAIKADTDDEDALRRLHNTTPPEEISGNTPHYYMPSSNADKVFQVIPFTATGDIYVNIKERYNTNKAIVSPEDIIPFDATYLIYATCMDYLADDGSSQMQYEKFKNLRDERLRQLKVLDNQGTFDYNDDKAVLSTNEWR